MVTLQVIQNTGCQYWNHSISKSCHYRRVRPTSDCLSQQQI